MNTITIEYKCERPPQQVRWTITAEDGANTADCKWEFEPPLDETTKDPAGVLNKLLLMMHSLIK